MQTSLSVFRPPQAGPALALETHKSWLEASRRLNMDLLKEHQKLGLAMSSAA